MNSDSTKKFFKKNALLQKSLQEFLHWRETKSDRVLNLNYNMTKNREKKQDIFFSSMLFPVFPSQNFGLPTFSSQKLEFRPPKTGTPKVDSPDRSSIDKSQSKKKLKKIENFYRPVLFRPSDRRSEAFRPHAEIKVGRNRKKLLGFQKNTDKLVFSNLFPHQKPFQHFWIFPLLLGCCLTLLTLKDLKKGTARSFGFPHFDLQGESRKNIQEQAEANVFDSTKFNKLSNDQEKFTSHLPTNVFLEGFYKKRNFQKTVTTAFSSDLNDLCRFYLNSTFQNIIITNNDSFGNDTVHSFLPTCPSQNFGVRPLGLRPSFQPKTEKGRPKTGGAKVDVLARKHVFKNLNDFDWIWHSLNTESKASTFIPSVSTVGQSPSDLLFGQKPKQAGQKNSLMSFGKILDLYSSNSLEQKMKNDPMIFLIKTNPEPILFQKTFEKTESAPHISYLKASKLFDELKTSMLMNKDTFFFSSKDNLLTGGKTTRVDYITRRLNGSILRIV